MKTILDEVAVQDAAAALKAMNATELKVAGLTCKWLLEQVADQQKVLADKDQLPLALPAQVAA